MPRLLVSVLSGGEPIGVFFAARKCQNSTLLQSGAWYYIHRRYTKAQRHMIANNDYQNRMGMYGNAAIEATNVMMVREAISNGSNTVKSIMAATDLTSGQVYTVLNDQMKKGFIASRNGGKNRTFTITAQRCVIKEIVCVPKYAIMHGVKQSLLEGPKTAKEIAVEQGLPLHGVHHALYVMNQKGKIVGMGKMRRNGNSRANAYALSDGNGGVKLSIEAAKALMSRA